MLKCFPSVLHPQQLEEDRAGDDAAPQQTFSEQCLVGHLFQVMETIQWLSDFFYKLRLSKLDFKSFGLFSKWTPYMADVKTFLGYLVKRLIDLEIASLAQDPTASSREGIVLPVWWELSAVASIRRNSSRHAKRSFSNVMVMEEKNHGIGVSSCTHHTCMISQRIQDACCGLSVPLLSGVWYKEVYFSNLG